MGLTNIPPPNWTDAQERAIQVRELIAGIIGHAESSLHQIRNIVRGNRSAIVAELGSDASAMLAVYNSLKEAVEVARGITIEELP